MFWFAYSNVSVWYKYSSLQKKNSFNFFFVPGQRQLSSRRNLIPLLLLLLLPQYIFLHLNLLTVHILSWLASDCIVLKSSDAIVSQKSKVLPFYSSSDSLGCSFSPIGDADCVCGLRAHVYLTLKGHCLFLSFFFSLSQLWFFFALRGRSRWHSLFFLTIFVPVSFLTSSLFKKTEYFSEKKKKTWKKICFSYLTSDVPV